MLPLLTALLAPVAGALVYVSMHHRERTVRLLDSAVLVVLPILVALQILSQVWSERTPLPILAVVAGAGLLALIERLSRTLARYTDDLTILFGVLGIALHALLEGSALTAEASPAFVLAVVVHRITVGLLIWWLVSPRHGPAAAAVGVAAIIGATLAGYLAGTTVVAEVSLLDPGVFEAFVAGTLLHVVFHQGRQDHRH